MTRHRIALAGTVCLSAALVLGGCAHQPGTAFSVGDTQVSRDTVDSVVRAQCSLIAAQSSQQSSQQGSQPQARATLLHSVVDAMLQGTIANAYADHFDTAYDDTTARRAQAQISAQVKGLPADEGKALTDAIVGVVRGQQIAQVVGGRALKARGTAKPTSQQAVTAGNRIVRRWAEQQGVSVNPRYDVGANDTAGSGDGSVSVPVTAFAKASTATNPSSALLAQLPPGQLCG